MPTYRDEAVVLRTHKLGEADRIITLLTRQSGKVRAVAKGVRRTKSRFGSRLEPFMYVDLQAYTGRSLDTITQVETIAAFADPIATNYELFTCASAMAEVADRVVTEEHQPAAAQFWLLVGALRALASGSHASGLVLDAYILRALSQAGWAPEVYLCAGCGMPGPHAAFSHALGGAACGACRPPGSRSVGPDTLDLLQAMLTGDWELADHSTYLTREKAHSIISLFAQRQLEMDIRSLYHIPKPKVDGPTQI